MSQTADNCRAAARAKLEKRQQSKNYRSFLNPQAVEAFAQAPGSALAGKPLR